MDRHIAELIEAQRYPDAAALLEQELDLCDEPSRALLLARELGTLLLDHLGDVDGARRAFERALSFDDHDRETLAPLARLCEMTGDFHQLIALHQRMAEVASDHPEIVAHYLAIARIARDALADEDLCRDYARQALDIDPDNVEAQRLTQAGQQES